ncbi:phage tail sheath family protein [Tolypothrix sp. FACHB-123]|nr:phage tail sheath family protein [Tolypothrix sp. FACHB-123]
MKNEDVTLKNDDQKKLALVKFKTAPPKGQTVTGDYAIQFPDFISVTEKEVKLCTSFTEFKKFFGDFSIDPGQQQLAHAVYGFFNNGGTRCYVTRVKDKKDIKDVLTELEVIDEISLVVAPGITDPSARNNIIDHCKEKTGDRFAIFDSEENADANNAASFNLVESDYAALYFPWIQVFDPATKAKNPNGNGLIFVPPSGHIAGIYARVDAQRGIHKAPANEVVSGAVGVEKAISKNQQDGLNSKGINCIRVFNSTIKVWGARTLSKSNELRYINVRRTLLFLRESIDEGTQWAVFEPNNPALWQKIKRNVSDFLLVQWRAGALFGNTEREAFYVKCDAETNPPTEVALGKVIAEVGVSIVRPAEFVIFRISQTTLPS